MPTPRIGSGRFQWNAGSWFGSLVGCTLWMLLMAIYAGAQNPTVSAIVGASFLLCNATAIALWRLRDRLPPYQSIQAQLAVTLLCAALSLWAVFAKLGADSLHRLKASPSATYWVLAVIPALMLQFHFLERTARRATLDREEDR